MDKILFSLAILPLIFSLSYCGNTQRTAASAEVLFRDKWKLKELEGQVVPDSTKSRFEFTPGKISGHTGCNQLSAGFTPGRNQTITFRPEIVAKTACEDKYAADLETRFLDALSKSTRWSIRGGELWLANGEATLIKLRSLQ
jgi:heat shock protein HslJ